MSYSIPKFSARYSATPKLTSYSAIEAYVRALVEVEIALARAEARLGVIPTSAAEQIC